jgi:flagellar basal-body rod modification protein FlgD
MTLQGILMAGTQARAADSTSNTNSTDNTNSNSGTSTTQLTGNDFITLLTAQLQAQDPLDPMDPDQMVNELTEMNSLQELIGIKQDLDSLLGTTSDSGSASNIAAANTAIASYTHAGALNPSYQDYVIQQKLFPTQTSANA